MILFVQSFGLGGAGGGSRVLRSLLKHAPSKWLSVTATADPIPPAPFGQEIHVRGRPSFGRLERTRFNNWFKKLDWWIALRLSKRLEPVILKNKVSGIHGIAHGCWDTVAAFNAAQRNNLPFFLTVHDDPAYCLEGHPSQKRLLDRIAEVWQKARVRFVISKELGEELCRRWGRKDYDTVTDGIAHIEDLPRPSHPNRLAVYFMGLLHLSYEANFIALQKALILISQSKPGLKVNLTIRSGFLRQNAIVAPELVQMLPFCGESELQSDLDSAELLYQPLSLEPAHRAMAAYSLSTKMISYLASGRPIFFHGPNDSAAGQLLAKNQAAFISDSNDPKEIARVLIRATGPERDHVVASALNLARKQFRLSDVRERFWNLMMHQL